MNTDSSQPSVHMDNQRTGFLADVFVISLALVSFACSIIAETKKLKKKDVKLRNDQCGMQQSQAFGFGVAALVCLVIAQTVSSFAVCNNFSSSSTAKNKKKLTIPSLLLLLLSWVSFGVAVVLLAGATSMSTRQGYGEGWVDDKCYVVKDGIYAGSGVLTLVSAAAAIGSTFTKDPYQQDCRLISS